MAESEGEEQPSQPRRARAQRPRPALRYVLVGLVLLAMLPTAVLSAGLMFWQWREHHDETQRHLTETLNAVAQSVDAEVESSLKRLQILAGSPTLSNDIDAFRDIAEIALATSGDWTDIVLLDPTGQQVMNTAVERGQPLPLSSDRQYFQEVRRARAPTVSDVIIGQVSGRPTVRVAQPVIRNGELLYVLAAELELSVFDALLSSRVVREGGIGSVLDRKQLFIARSRDSHRFLGRPVIEDIRDEIERHLDGFQRSRVYDGPEVFTAWTRAPFTGWTVTLGVPAAPVEAALRRSLLGLGGAGLALLFVTGLGALLWARRVSSSIASASEAAIALAERRAVPPVEIAVREVEELATAIARTSELLRSHDQERDHLLASERDARALAERESRGKDEFLAMLGHELRNPLAAISASVALLGRTQDPAAQQLGREMIARQTSNLTRLVDDLLDVARVAAGKVRIVKAPVRLDEVARHAVEGMFDRDASHEVQTELEPAWVNGDATRLEQIVVNLLGNARKFTPAGGRIRTRVYVDGDDAVLQISDEGAGIPPELLPRVFDPFVQGQQPIDRRPGGLGIGLTLVHHLATMHGGCVQASSQGAGAGTTFTVRLPRIAAMEDDVAEDATPASQRQRRVVVIEDNDDARVSLVSLLQSWGHEVRAAANGQEGVALVDDMSPDVAIVDIGLPGLDGYGVARAVRQSGKSRAPRLFALTGYGSEDDRARSLAAGFDEHLVKPVDVESLARLLQQQQAA